MNFFIYLLVMAGVTYLIRLLPLLLVKKQIKNRFILSFLHYVPCSVLAVMTVPAIFTSNVVVEPSILSSGEFLIAAVVGFAVAAVLSFFEKSLMTVAVSACGAVLVTELLLMYVI